VGLDGRLWAFGARQNSGACYNIKSNTHGSNLLLAIAATERPNEPPTLMLARHLSALPRALAFCTPLSRRRCLAAPYSVARRRSAM
jgi:hypothetical protein